MKEETNLINVVQLPIIEQQLKEVSERMTLSITSALELECNEDTYKELKKIKANLNKEFEMLEAQRKAAKKEVLAPYEAFESIYKELITDKFKTLMSQFSGKITEVESGLKEQKRNEVVYYFDELCEANGLDFFTWERANINVTLSASMKSLKEQAKSAVERVCDDLKLIQTQEHKDEILYEYKLSLNVTSAITMVANRYKAIEEAKARAEASKAVEEQKQQAVEKVEEAIEELAPPVTEEPIYEVSFKVRATLPKIKALKEFLNNGGYEYE